MNRIISCLLLFTLILFARQTASAQLNISVEDHSGYGREAWPVTGGIPFPKGYVRDIHRIGITGALSQGRVLSRWSDGSIKWALIDYQADIPKWTKSTRHVVVTGTSAEQGNQVTETPESITVNTGRLKFTVSKRHFSFLQEVWVDLNRNGKYERNEEIVKKESGQEFSYDLQANNPERPTIPYAERNLLTGTGRPVENSQPVNPGGSRWIRPEGGGEETRHYAGDELYSARVIENGPLRTVVQIKGSFGSSPDDNRFTIWIHAYKGKSFLRIQHNFEFRGDAQRTNIRRMGLMLPMNFKTLPVFTAAGLKARLPLQEKDTAYLLSQGPADVFNLAYRGFPLNWEVATGNDIRSTGIEKTGGWIDVSTPRFGVTLVMKDMAYKYPKELSYDAGRRSVNAWIWPDHGGQVLDLRASGWPDGMRGISITHDIFYAFHGEEKEDYSESMAAAFNDPPQPYANPEWYSYRGTRAAGMLMPHDDRQFPQTEAFLATGTAFIERSMTEFGWLGMLNYGDLMFMYGYHKQDGALGTWGISNRRDDYDGWRRGNTMISYRMLMQYLRTGEYRYWQSAAADIQFIRDVLIKHYNGTDSRYVGFGRRHSAYWGAARIKEIDRSGGVSYDGYGTDWLGNYIYWNLTGDWRTYEVINEIRNAWNHWGNTVVDQLSGGAYVGLKTVSSIPGYEKAAKEADHFLDTAIRRTAHPGDAWRDCTWFMGYGLYLQDTDDPQITKAILDWWKAGAHNIDQWGLYWHREALAAVYWAAKDDKDIRDSVYRELSTIGSTESVHNSRMEAEGRLYRKFGVSGLFHCDMLSLANAVAPRYWRAKDDIIQLQWDEPLGMAVISHYREHYIDNAGTAIKPRDKKFTKSHRKDSPFGK